MPYMGWDPGWTHVLRKKSCRTGPTPPGPGTLAHSAECGTTCTRAHVRYRFFQ